MDQLEAIRFVLANAEIGGVSFSNDERRSQVLAIIEDILATDKKWDADHLDRQIQELS